jgi:hypothetical protein
MGLTEITPSTPLPELILTAGVVSAKEAQENRDRNRKIMPSGCCFFIKPPWPNILDARGKLRLTKNKMPAPNYLAS